MMTGKFKFFTVVLCLAEIIRCSQKGESGSEVIIKFDGGTVTMDEINIRAAAHLEMLRKRENEIRYRTAVRILMDKIDKIENRDTAGVEKQEGRGSPEKTESRPAGLSVNKNNLNKDEASMEIKKSMSIPGGEDLQKIFVKYKVQNNLKKPE